MKQNKSFLSKLIGKNEIELDPGDIIFFKDKKTYWVYLGKDSESNNSEGNPIQYKHGLWTSDYITKVAYDPEQMYKVNNDIIFHFKFKDDKTLDDIIAQFKMNNATYIMTLNAEELSALNAAYTLYDIKNSKK